MIYTTKTAVMAGNPCDDGEAVFRELYWGHGDDEQLPLDSGLVCGINLMYVVWCLRVVTDGPVASVSLKLARQCYDLVTERGLWRVASVGSVPSGEDRDYRRSAEGALMKLQEAIGLGGEPSAACWAHHVMFDCKESAPELEPEFRKIFLAILEEQNAHNHS